MIQDKEKYFKIFKLELKNLVTNVSLLIEYEKDMHNDEIHSNFVYLENLVVLKDEIMGINGLLGQLDHLTKDLSDAHYITELEKIIEDFIKERGYPMAVFKLVKQKMKIIDDILNIR